MKKRIIAILTVLLILTGISQRISATTNYTTLLINETKTVTVQTYEDITVFEIHPAEDAWYTFASGGSKMDPYAYLYENTYAPGTGQYIKFADDLGDGEMNFEMNAYLYASKTYYLEVGAYGEDGGSFTVSLKKTFATAFASEFLIPYNDNVLLQVVGACLNTAGVKYQWYICGYNMTNGKELSDIVVGETGPTLQLNNVKTGNDYYCMVTAPNGDKKRIDYYITISNDFYIYYSPMPYFGTFFLREGEYATVVTIANAIDASDMSYYLYETDKDCKELTFIEKSSNGIFSVPAGKETSYYMIRALDRYHNKSENGFNVHPVTPVVVKTNTSWDYTESEKGVMWCEFTAPKDGTYRIYSEGNSDPGIIILNEYSDILHEGFDEYDDDGNFVSENFNVTISAEEGQYFLFQIYMQDQQGTCRIYLESEASSPDIAGMTNYPAYVKVHWAPVKNASKYNVYRRVKGASSWGLAAQGVTGNVYEDKKADKMGTKYEYAVKAYVSGSWTDYGKTGSVTRNIFEDVKTTDGYFSYLVWAYNNGIVSGTSSTTFSPDGECTRAQLAIMLYRLNGNPAVSGTAPFSDIGSYSSNVKKAIAWCYNQGIVGGYDDGTYRPGDSVTRAQMAVMLWRMAGKPNPASNTTPFTDLGSCGSQAKKAIAWAYGAGITKGTSATKFGPNDACLRKQLVIFLYRYNDIYHLIK